MAQNYQFYHSPLTLTQGNCAIFGGMESIRQQKVASEVQKGLGQIFQKHGAEYYSKAFVTITVVKMSPDLLQAKVFLSIFNVEDPQMVLKKMRSRAREVRGRLGKLLKHMRRIPELDFQLDDSLDKVFQIEELLKDG